MSTPRPSHPTYTSLVTEYLERRDDFVGFAELLFNVGCTPDQLRAALHSLQGYKAIDCVSTPDGPFWFITPHTDQRIRTMKRMCEHTKHRPAGKHKRKPAPTTTQGEKQ